MISTHMQRMREKLRAGKIVLGAGITLSDPTVTEAIAPSVDFVWIDLEHNALTVEKMLGHLIAARAGGFHYRYDGTRWKDTKSEGEFFADLSRYASLQAGEDLRFSS